MNSDPTHSLISAFRHAHYIVFLPDGDITLHIGKPSPALSRLLAAHSAESLAILTAYNPDAETKPLPANQAAQTSLEAEVDKLELTVIRGQNRASDGDGPAEPTVAVLGIDVAAAAALAARYGQLAFVFADAAATPQLMWKQGGVYNLLR